MALTDITQTGVESAVTEFDRIGREAFLNKYGFGEARSYFLIVANKRYDSKAIAGAAHGYSRPAEGPLPASEFSGGEATVRRTLERLGFTVVNSSGSRNPDWMRDELILALDVYMEHRPQIPGKTSPAVVSFSRELNQLAPLLGLAGNERFRNPNGVYMKLINLRRFDPEFISSGKVGLPGGAESEEEVWRRFSNDRPGLTVAAAAIRRALSGVVGGQTSDRGSLPDEDNDGLTEALEGRIVTRMHRHRERDGALPRAKKADVLKRLGRLECEACGFDFAARYGKRGEGFAECHHINWLSASDGERKTDINDLAIVCANCHRMIHSAAPWLTIEELRSIVAAAYVRSAP